MNLKCLIIALTVLFAVNVHGQKADDLVGDLNTHLLDSLVLIHINEIRLQEDQPKLYWNSALASKASKHSRRMVEQNKVFYPERSGVGQCVLDLLVIQYDVTYAQLALQVVERWLNSPGHKSLLMDSYFTSVGIGSAFMFSEEIGIQLKVTCLLKYE